MMHCLPCLAGAVDEGEGPPSSEAGFAVERYPMHAMRVRDFLALTMLAPHQELVSRGLVVALDLEGAHAGEMINFVSHQWLGYATADPRGDHLRTMQDCFRRVGAGERVFKDENFKRGYLTGFAKNNVTNIHAAAGWTSSSTGEITDEQFQRSATDGWVWMDYISIPQTVNLKTEAELQLALKQQADAIASIPLYVARAFNFYVCAPSGATHADAGHVCNFATRGTCATLPRGSHEGGAASRTAFTT